MNRARDYINFAVKFVGLGYIVLWPLSRTGTTGDVFGAGLVCGGRLGAVADHLCRLPHPLRLSLGLHVVGALFAALAVLHLATWALREQRKPRASDAGSPASPASQGSTVKRRPRFRLRPLPLPRKLGRPRKEFGLRGVPR